MSRTLSPSLTTPEVATNVSLASSTRSSLESSSRGSTASLTHDLTISFEKCQHTRGHSGDHARLVFYRFVAKHAFLRLEEPEGLLLFGPRQPHCPNQGAKP